MRPVALLLLATLMACATPTIPNTSVIDTPENRQIVALIETYRQAMEQRDTGTLKSLASSNYYENSSSTWTSEDDWGYPDLDTVLSKFKEHVKSVSYEVAIAEVRVLGQHAEVDVECTWAFLYTDGEREAWTKKSDSNQFRLVKEEGGWRILSGM